MSKGFPKDFQREVRSDAKGVMYGQSNHFYEFGAFRLDTQERRLLRNGEPVPLPPKVYDVLLVLVENSGQTIEKETLMKAVWPDIFVEEANLTVNISALRKALGESISEYRYIETVPRRGYRFVPTVTEVKDETAGPLVEEPNPAPLVIEEPDRTETGKENLRDGERAFPVFGVSVTMPRGWRLTLWVAGVSALLVGLSVMAYQLWVKRAAPSVKVRSIAVLPFKPLSTDSRDEPLEMGMCDALITRLGGLNQLLVRPTSSIVRYNKPGQDPLAAGRELGVDALLDGYLQRSGDKIRVTAQLLSIADGKHLWSGQFNENFTDIFAVEDSISRQIVEALRLKLTGEEQHQVTKHYTDNVEAYQLYLKGRYFQDKRTPEGLKKSIDYFQQAIEKDPNYALAFAGLADSYVVLAVRSDMRPRDSSREAKTTAMRALEIDETIAEAHASLANVRYWYDWDWPEAESEFKRAIELSPNYPAVHQYYSTYLIAMGRHEEAISEIKQALGLAPLSLQLNVQVVRILYFAHRYDEAIEQCRKVLELDPDYRGTHVFLGRTYNQKRMYKQALAELEMARELLGDDPEILSLIGYTWAVSGRRAEAQKVLEELRRLTKQRYVSPYHLAMVYAGLGEPDEAFDLLAKAYEDREGRMTILKFVPEFDSLHSDSRYANLVRRVGLLP
jgi:DNA-binding winged helix-turn-helix (wHTH) protein/TolB-like protein/tetratricopeptide (TPR) repeat protein